MHTEIIVARGERVRQTTSKRLGDERTRTKKPYAQIIFRVKRGGASAAGAGGLFAARANRSHPRD